MGALAGAVLDIGGALMGQALANTNDTRQLHQQENLNEIQKKFNWADRMQALGINKMSAEQLPTATVEGMKAAGLNPALAYGLTGAGGTTTNGGAGNGPEAPKGGHEIAEGAGLGLQTMAQLGLMEAQKKNIEADTANKIAENPNFAKTGAKIDTETANIAESTKSITQGITESRARTALTNADRRLRDVQGNVAEQSQDDAIKTIHSQWLGAMYEARSAMFQANVDEKTQESKIELLNQQALGAALINALTQANTDNAKAQLKLINAQTGLTNAQTTNTNQQTAESKSRVQVNEGVLNKMTYDIVQNWDNIDIEQDRNRIMEKLGMWGIGVQAAGKVVDFIGELTGNGGIGGLLKKKPGKIGFK